MLGGFTAVHFLLAMYEILYIAVRVRRFVVPNHVFSEIVIHGAPMAKVAPMVLSDAGVIDFCVMLPLPVNFWAGSVGKEHTESFPGTQLDAARSTWGTKWNAYGKRTISEVEGDTVITFETAWNTPRGWICALFNTLRCDITVLWLDEGRDYPCRETFKIESSVMGDDWKLEQLDCGSPEHLRLHKMFWGKDYGADD